MRWCDEYLNRAMAQVRVKRIREPLSAELRDHLELQKAVYMDAGVPEDEAGRRAIEDMGDPLLVGGALDAAHRSKVCRQGVLIATALLAFGLILRLAFGNRAELALSPLYFIVMAVSAGAIALFACTDYTQWMWTAAPIGSLWAAACIYRILSLLDGAMPMPFAEFPLRSVLLPVPQCLAVALPVLVALLASRLRGANLPEPEAHLPRRRMAA